MSYYKLKNITNTLGKRDFKANTAQTVDFKDNINSGSVVINPGAEIVVEASYLPVSAQKLRTEGVITVIEIERNTYLKLLNAQDARVAEQNAPRPIESNEDKKSKQKSK